MPTTHVWYTNLSDQGNAESGNSYGADNLLTSKSGVYIRKKSDDYDVNNSPLYTYVASDTKGAAPFYCTWLGFKPFNGQRRETIQFRVADRHGVGGTTYDSDPLVRAAATDPTAVRPAGVDLRQDITAQIDALKTWYTANLKWKENRGDGYDANHVLEYVNFRPNYYLLGLYSSASTENKELPQTIGWQDNNNSGAMGTFDPLEE